MRRNPDWTEKEDATALRLRRTGVSPTLIGERLGRSATAVAKRLHWLGLDEEQRAAFDCTKRNRKKPDAEASL